MTLVWISTRWQKLLCNVETNKWKPSGIKVGFSVERESFQSIFVLHSVIDAGKMDFWLRHLSPLSWTAVRFYPTIRNKWNKRSSWLATARLFKKQRFSPSNGHFSPIAISATEILSRLKSLHLLVLEFFNRLTDGGNLIDSISIDLNFKKIN